jgi:glycosyltransferase involved in cell wall biosynthesis
MLDGRGQPAECWLLIDTDIDILMQILIICKYPPIQGGTSTETYWTATELALRGHHIDIITNAPEVEAGFRQFWLEQDKSQVAPYPTMRVHFTTPLSQYSHIPESPAYGSRLFGLALSVAEADPPDLIIGWYFEPYGLIAAQVGSLLRIPVVILHAGSDIGRLASNPDLARSYSWMLSVATRIITVEAPEVIDCLAKLGNVCERRCYATIARLPPAIWCRRSSFDLNGFLQHKENWCNQERYGNEESRLVLSLCEKPWCPEVPTIGVYGKVGDEKGSFDLLHSLGRLARCGVEFNFVTIPCGTRRQLSDYLLTLAAMPELAGNTWVLPAIAPWRVPSFLQSCAVVCCLEHGFWLPFHGSSVVRETLASGSVLVASSEVVRKHPLSRNLISGVNLIEVGDPGSHGQLASCLASVIRDSGSAEEIGANGRHLYAFWEQSIPDKNRIPTVLEQI